jgi:hypothetical protein
VIHGILRMSVHETAQSVRSVSRGGRMQFPKKESKSKVKHIATALTIGSLPDQDYNII